MLLALKLLTLVGPPNWNRSENLVFPGPKPHSKPERAAKDTDFNGSPTRGSTSLTEKVVKQTHHSTAHGPRHLPLGLGLVKTGIPTECKPSYLLVYFPIRPTRCAHLVVPGIEEESVGE